MADYVMKMSILVSNINHRGQKDFSFKFATKHILPVKRKYKSN